MSVVLSLLVAITMVVAVGLVTRAILYASRSKGASDMDAVNMQRAVLEEDKQRALRAIRELEFDLRSRKISQQDYDELRVQQEELAVTAMRALRQLDANPSSDIITRIVLIMVLTPVMVVGFGSTTHAQPALPDGHPPVDQPSLDESGGVGSVSGIEADGTVRVTVWRADLSGALLRHSGAEVVLELRRRDPGPAEVYHVLEGAVAVTDVQGNVVFRGVGRVDGAEMRVTVVHQGYLFDEKVATIGDEITTLIVYDSIPDSSSLSYRIQTQISVDERMVRVTSEYVLLNTAPHAVRLGSDNTPFFLPLLSPVVGGEVILRGWLPRQAPGNSSLKVEPRGRVQFTDGGVAFTGLVLPGESTRVRFVYPLDIVDDFMVLGFRSETIPIRELYVALIWGTLVEPSLDILPENRGVRMDRAGERVVLARVLDVLDVGDAAIIRVGRLPDPGGVRHDIALWGGAVFGLLFIAALLRARAIQTNSLQQETT